MGIPIRSRLLDYVEAEPSPEGAPAGLPTQEAPRSRLLDYVDHGDQVGAGQAAGHTPPGQKPVVPPYHTPVFVPAHPRYVDSTDPSGATTRVPFIAYELFAHPVDGTVALAFTTLDRLVAALGEAQPWVATSIGPLAEGLGAQAVTVRLDPRLTPGPPNWHHADLASYARQVR
ncbi:SAV_915 family protein [Streptomyces sp. NBC_00076]|uniref:SAV_915 family protein n=1 Tax=Streptomyces sp. NBC_00076 TaxID=2975642 RepID=UPI003247488C